MTTRTVSRLALPVVLLGGLALGDSVASAQGENGWRLRLYAAAMDFDGSSNRPGDYSAGGGVGVNAEYRFSRRLGLDLGLLIGGGVDVRFGNVPLATETVAFNPLSAGLNIHLTPESKVDLYLGPLLAWVHHGSVSYSTRPRFERVAIHDDDGLALGGNLGVDVPFGRGRWSFNARLTYYDGRLNGSDWDGAGFDADYQATALGLGVGYRFGSSGR